MRHRLNTPPILALRSGVTTAVAPLCHITNDAAVDFPAAIDAFERAKAAFGDHEVCEAPAVEAEIWLSRHEARNGAVAPVEAPLRWTCLVCGGRGESWMEPCRACRGAGEYTVRRRVWLVVPPCVTQGARLRFTVTPPSEPTTRLDVQVRIGVRDIGRRRANPEPQFDPRSHEP